MPIYQVAFKHDFKITVREPNAHDAIHAACFFAHKNVKEVESVNPIGSESDCAVDRNEVKCPVSGCSGPYNCKERGLDSV